MSISHRERIEQALDLFKNGFSPFVERELESALSSGLLTKERLSTLLEEVKFTRKNLTEWDVSALIKITLEVWNEIFRTILGASERSLVFEIKEWRNKWAHQAQFSGDDTYRALDSIERLLTAISAQQSEEVEKLKHELLRLRYEEQVRNEKRKTVNLPIENQTENKLLPWRDVIKPHDDVANGNYQQAEFAADLWQVYQKKSVGEYQDPIEFFKRTYLTESLKKLLANAIKRTVMGNGQPVIQLQTNFGGGKTHSMLALFHLFSGTEISYLEGMDNILLDIQKTDIEKLPKIKRIVLVGNKLSPGNPEIKEDGIIIHTIWGELAYQLGGKSAYDEIALDDQKATSPGDTLGKLFDKYGPCLILIDEWVSYARQLHDRFDLPAGTFDTQFTFAQTLTEAVKSAKKCLLVVSLPASDTENDIEVGGNRGREALERLRNVIGRIESSWLPANTEESFEIVRRRLFKKITSNEHFKQRDFIAKTFAEFYRTQKTEFPVSTQNSSYEERIKASYPIHPELFDRLYQDWSTLAKFQRTRGVLRLMSAVIHHLWEIGDRNPMILPANIAIDEQRIKSELLHYLDDKWSSIIEKDVGGPDSLPIRLDKEITNLGKLSACRRIARTIYIGSAPTSSVTNRGIDDKYIKLGCVMPGESPNIFGDALRHLSKDATYLYKEDSRYWYALQPTLTKLAREESERIKQDHGKINAKIEETLHIVAQNKEEFEEIYIAPIGSKDIPDEFVARLVILGPAHPYIKETGNAAEIFAKTILENRGNTPRLYRNTLFFLVPDKIKLSDLEKSTSELLAWQFILNNEASLGLTTYQKEEVKQHITELESEVNIRIAEVYQWLLMPETMIESSNKPVQQIIWKIWRLPGTNNLIEKASNKLRSEECLILNLGSTILVHKLNEIPLWRGEHVSIKQLIKDFSSYTYLPKLKNQTVLLRSIMDSVKLANWEKDGFGLADAYDESNARYQALRFGENVQLNDTYSSQLIVKPEIVKQQLEKEKQAQHSVNQNEKGKLIAQQEIANSPIVTSSYPTEINKKHPRKFSAAISLDISQINQNTRQISEEVISHLANIKNAKISISMTIDADLPDGLSEETVRTVIENCRALKFIKNEFLD